MHGVPPETKNSRPSRSKREVIAALDDARNCFRDWRIWTTLAINDISHRYRRSIIGPFWMTCSMGIFILAMGMVSHSILRPSADGANAGSGGYLVYLSVGYVLWGFLSGCLNESCYAFTNLEGYMKQVAMPKISAILLVVLRNLIIFGHNAIIIIVVMVWFDVPMTLNMLLVIPALLVSLWFSVAIGLLLGIVCTRFRDMNQVMLNIVQVAFFISPIFWDPLTADPIVLQWSQFNPLSSYLTIFRSPLIGRPLDGTDWLIAVGWAAAVSVITAVFFVRFRRRIVYWL